VPLNNKFEIYVPVDIYLVIKKEELTQRFTEGA
jgi:hypothetical protein